MFVSGLWRIAATVFGLVSVLCAAVSAPILFSWAIDSSRPVRLAPLALSAGLLALAALLALARRKMLIHLAAPGSQAGDIQRAV